MVKPFLSQIKSKKGSKFRKKHLTYEDEYERDNDDQNDVDVDDNPVAPNKKTKYRYNALLYIPI